MTSTPMEIGTLIVVILKAKNLPNKRHIGKQDPYCSVKLNAETRRTRAIKRGGQHPEWDEEVRFTIFEDVEDELARTATAESEEPPPPPPKKEKKKVKGPKKMQVMCYADDPKEPELIGETFVDLTEVLTKGETDEWFTLTSKEKYCGEVYLELTFWSNEKPPERQPTSTPSVFHPQYGGPGSFTPSSELPASLKHGGSNQNTPSPSRIPSSSGSDAGLPASLRPSGSLAKLNLYNAPYEQQNRPGDAIDYLSNGIGNLDFDGPSRRRESFPRQSGPSEFGYVGTVPLPHSESFSTLSSSGSLSSIHSVGSSLGARTSQGHHQNSLTSLPEPFVKDDYSSNRSHILPPASELHAPEPQYQYLHSSGFIAPPSHTPTPSQVVPAAPGSHQVSSGFALPQHSSSTAGFHLSQPPQHQYPISSQSSFQPSYPPPSAAPPPNQYLPPNGSPSSIPPISHSAPPQQFIPQVTPPSPHHTRPGLPLANAYQQIQPSNPPPGSRPLPTPQVPQQPYSQSSIGFSTPYSPQQSVAPGSLVYPNATQYQPPGPPPPPPSLSPPPARASLASFPPPPPPPPSLHNENHPQQVSYLETQHRPPQPPSQFFDRRSSSPPAHGPHPAFPEPPQHPQGFATLPPPPPPPFLSNYSNPPLHGPLSVPNYPASPPHGQQLYYPGPPPLPPPQFPAGPSWNAPPPHPNGWHP